MTDVAFTPHSLPQQIIRPEKIIWQFPAGVAPLDQIKSSSLKKFLAKAEEHLHENQINWNLEPLSAVGFYIG
jgi:hypothetical protein